MSLAKITTKKTEKQSEVIGGAGHIKNILPIQLSPLSLAKISWTGPTSLSGPVWAHEAPPKRPHFHATTTTTTLQPESPLSANFAKMTSS